MVHPTHPCVLRGRNWTGVDIDDMGVDADVKLFVEIAINRLICFIIIVSLSSGRCEDV